MSALKPPCRCCMARNKLAYTIEEAAEATGVSPGTIRRALHTTDPQVFPAPLQGKQAGRRLMVLRAELERWVEAWPDA